LDSGEQTSVPPLHRRARLFICQAIQLSLELHVNFAASEVDINASLRGGKQDRHTGRICHGGGTLPTGKSHSPPPRATRVVMTIEIFKLLQMVNFARSGTPGNSDLA